VGFRHNAGLVRFLEAGQKKAAVASFEQALRAVFFCQVVFACLAMLSALPIEERPLLYVSYAQVAMAILTHSLTEIQIHMRSTTHRDNEPQVQRRERYESIAILLRPIW
jgi:hypothetical protein